MAAITSIRKGAFWGIFGYAHICEGSVVRSSVLGWTPRHAEKRAEKRLRKSQ